MATEKVNYDIKVYDNFIEIIPKGGVKDNSIYEIKLKGLVGANGEEFEDETIKFVTAMTPMYCNKMDVSSLLDIVEIPEDIILYNIREASRYADYVYEQAYKRKKLNKNNIPFEVKEFTRFKAAKDCMLKIYMALVSDNVIEGTLGEVTFKLRDQVPDIKKILDYLDKEIQKWLDAIQGYHIEGRARMRTAIKGYHHGGRNPMSSLESSITPKSVPVSLDRGVYWCTQRNSMMELWTL